MNTAHVGLEQIEALNPFKGLNIEGPHPELPESQHFRYKSSAIIPPKSSTVTPLPKMDGPFFSEASAAGEGWGFDIV